jgi:hypothetical protein
MRRRRITKADLENKVSELMAENKYLLSMFEMTARRLDAYKKADYERKLKEPRPGYSLTIITGKKKHHDSII